MHMLIRHATMEDLDAIEAVEAACFPPAEAASNESLTARVAAYPDHFWLLVNTDDDDTPFPSRVEDGTLVGFVDGMATNEPNLASSYMASARFGSFVAMPSTKPTNVPSSTRREQGIVVISVDQRLKWVG